MGKHPVMCLSRACHPLLVLKVKASPRLTLVNVIVQWSPVVYSGHPWAMAWAISRGLQ
jgi:hypothetical protein